MNAIGKRIPARHGSRLAPSGAFRLAILACLVLTHCLWAWAAGTPSDAQTQALVPLLAAARADRGAYLLLAELTDDIGPRLAGSPALARAVDWAEVTLRRLGLQNVRREAAMVPHWVRHSERLTMLAPERRELPMLGLGDSPGTPGIEAPVVVLHGFDELSAAVAGKIVLFNVPMAPGTPAVAHYGAAAQYRAYGARRAAPFGALAVLVRSVTVHSLATVHTGASYPAEDAKPIPAAAITVEDADLIDRLTSRGIEVRVRLEMGAEKLADALSHNVIGEICGSEHPEEVVVVGGHLDSWDVGRGAHDDGAGIVEVITAMRLIRELGVAPRRTIRVVLFTNEENGIRGGKAYAAAHGDETHLAAIETDLGGGAPVSWSAKGSPEALAWLRAVAAPLGLPVEEGGSGVDISPLEGRGVLCVGLRPDDSRYFDVHHTAADTLDKVDPAALAEATAAVTGLTWLLANVPR